MRMCSWFYSKILTFTLFIDIYFILIILKNCIYVFRKIVGQIYIYLYICIYLFIYLFYIIYMDSQKQLKLCRFPQRTCKLMRLKVVI